MRKQVGKNLTRAVTISRSLTKRVGKNLTRAVTISRSLTKRVGKTLTRAVTISRSLTKRVGKTLTRAVTISRSLTKRIGKTLARPVSIVASMLHTQGAPPPEELPTFIAFGPNTQTAAIATKRETVVIGSYKTAAGLSNPTTGAAIAPRSDRVTVVDQSSDADILYG